MYREGYLRFVKCSAVTGVKSVCTVKGKKWFVKCSAVTEVKSGCKVKGIYDS